MLTLGQYLALAPFREVDSFIDLLVLFATKSPDYKKRVDAIPDGLLPGNTRELANAGMIGHATLLQLLLAKDDSQGVRNAIVQVLVKRAIEWSLISEMIPNMAVAYMFNEARILELASKDILKNVLIDQPEYLVESYKHSILAIHVEKDKTPYIGTGFLALVRSRDHARKVLITAKHNIDPADGISVEQLENPYGLQIQASELHWHLHPTYDLAASELPPSAEAKKFLQITDFAPVLSETVTLGFPRVPTADKLLLLAHRGEINANVTSYLRPGPYLLISNAVGPGNSGSPVVARSGLVVGMVTEAFESTETFGMLRMQAALNSSAIIEFLNTQFP